MAQTHKYTGTFRKKNGETRAMTFLRIAELNDEQKSKIGLTIGASANKQIYLQPGFEIVFDLDANGFRTFNWNGITVPVSKELIEF